MKTAGRIAAALLAAGVLASAVTTAAHAHVGISPTEGPAGKVLDLSLSVGHGCDGAATTSLEVKMPEGVVDYSVGKVAGWQGDKPAPGLMRWRGGPLPDSTVLDFPFKAEFSGRKGEVLVFPVVQGCEGGLETAWISTGDDSGAGHGTPAPTLTLTSSAAAPQGDEPGTGGQGTDDDQTQSGAGTSQGAVADEQLSADDSPAGDDDDGFPVLRVIGLILIVASVTGFIVVRRTRSRAGQ
jgi:uncharacterized protein YcnI